MIINNTEEALRYFEKIVNIPIYSVLPTKLKRHRFIFFNQKTKFGQRAYLIFKRSPFIYWDKIFKKAEELKNEFPDIEKVDSMNIDAYYYALERFNPHCIAIIYETGDIYLKKPDEILEVANKYHLYRKVKRLNFNDKDDYEMESTLSFPLLMGERLK